MNKARPSDRHEERPGGWGSTNQYQGNIHLSLYTQPLITYIIAGYNSFRMAYSTGHFGANHRPYRIDNPYSKKPFNRLWRRGWDEAFREWENDINERGISFSRPNPFANNQRIQEFIRQIERREVKKSKPKTHPAQTGRVNTAKPNTTSAPKHKPYKGKPKQKTEQGAISLKQINRFNKKHRTA